MKRVKTICVWCHRKLRLRNGKPLHANGTATLKEQMTNRTHKPNLGEQAISKGFDPRRPGSVLAGRPVDVSVMAYMPASGGRQPVRPTAAFPLPSEGSIP